VSLPVLYQDDDFIIVDKPAKLLVHNSEMAWEKQTAMSVVRDQVGKWVYLVHRLDRGTSGALVMGLSSEAAGLLSKNFREKTVRKTYHAWVRGRPAEAGVIDRPLVNDKGHDALAAVTRYRRVHFVDLPVQVSKYPRSLYAMVEVEPETGRFNQIRRHMAGATHPLIGDKMYGDPKHNNYFRTTYGVDRMMLHARRLEFDHPRTGARVCVEAPWPEEFARLSEVFGFSLPT